MPPIPVPDPSLWSSLTPLGVCLVLLVIGVPWLLWDQRKERREHRAEIASLTSQFLKTLKDEEVFRNALSDRYENEQLTPALPGDPLLVARIQVRAGEAGRHQLSFLPKSGQGFNVQLTEPLLHGFARLLQDSLRTTNWDLELKLPEPPASASTRPN